MRDTLIEMKRVSAGYGRRKALQSGGDALVIRDVSLRIREGTSVCLLGPNGCGKTTLLRVIAGMLHAYGEVLIDGKEIRSLRRKEIASYISFLSQISHVYYSYSVYETVLQGRYVHGHPVFLAAAPTDREIVEETLETLGLQDIAGKQITSLSGGQLQRVMLARCIAQGSPVLILDEPMNHLDMKVQAEFLEFLLKWREKPVRMHGERLCRPTLIGVFHDINIAAYIADEIALISEGRLLSFGQKKDMLKEELLEETYRFDVAGYLRKYDRYALSV